MHRSHIQLADRTTGRVSISDLEKPAEYAIVRSEIAGDSVRRPLGDLQFLPRYKLPGEYDPPYAPGPYIVCHDKTYTLEDEGLKYVPKLRIYKPGHYIAPHIYVCDKNVPLVLIFKAAGAPAPQYDGLARHLTSHGFTVAVVTQHLVLETTKGYLGVLFKWLESSSKSPVRDTISQQRALIGHSYGGKTVMRYADEGTPLQAVVLLAPNFKTNGEAFYDHEKDLYAPGASLLGVTKSFLVINVDQDADSTAWAFSKSIEPKWTAVPVGILAFDRVDVSIPSNPETNVISKHTLYLTISPANSNLPPDSVGSHYCQNTEPILAYMAAFLRWQVKGHEQYKGIFRDQLVPEGVSPSVRPQFQYGHTDRTVLLNFSKFDGVGYGPVGTTLNYTSAISNVKYGRSVKHHPAATFDTPCMLFDVDYNEVNRRILLKLPGGETLNFALWTYLSIRVARICTRGLPDELQPSDNYESKRAVRIFLRGDGGASKAIDAWTPEQSCTLPILSDGEYSSAQKDRMQTLNFRISDFGEFSEKVWGIAVLFPGVSIAEKTRFAITDLALY